MSKIRKPDQCKEADGIILPGNQASYCVKHIIQVIIYLRGREHCDSHSGRDWWIL